MGSVFGQVLAQPTTGPATSASITIGDVGILMRARTSGAIQRVKQTWDGAEPFERLALAEALVQLIDGPVEYADLPALKLDGLDISKQQTRAIWGIHCLLGVTIEAHEGEHRSPAAGEQKRMYLLLIQAYRRGIEQASDKARASLDLTSLERFRDDIVEGARSQSHAKAGADAMRELLLRWPPIGANLTTFTKLTGGAGKREDDKIILNFDQGFGGIQYVFRIHGDRIVSVAASYGA